MSCNLYHNHMMDCVYCHSDQIIKNGKLPSWWQRFKCHECDHQFTTWGKRGTYNPIYKEQVVKEYCHTPATAQEVIQKHHISSKTLIDWSKKHKTTCTECQQK